MELRREEVACDQDEPVRTHSQWFLPPICDSISTHGCNCLKRSDPQATRHTGCEDWPRLTSTLQDHPAWPRGKAEGGATGTVTEAKGPVRAGGVRSAAQTDPAAYSAISQNKAPGAPASAGR